MLRNGAVLSDLTPGIAYSIKVYSYSTEQKLLSRSSVSVRASTKEAGSPLLNFKALRLNFKALLFNFDYKIV